MILATSELRKFQRNNMENLLEEEFTLKGASIDLRINNTIKVLKKNNIDIDLLDDNVEHLIENELYEEKELANKDYWLEPNQYIYGSTYEKITIPKDKCAILLPRSTFARMGLILPLSQYANPGYSGHLPIIIFNSSQNRIKIPPYYRVMQMLIVEIKGEAQEYEKQNDEKYHNETEPSNPKNYKDMDIKKILGIDKV